MQSISSELISEVFQARLAFIGAIRQLTVDQSTYKPDANTWCITEIAEHLFWAEFGAINGMWKALFAFKAGKPVYEGDLPHGGLKIEEIIQKTWQEKELVPEIAKPKWGGPVQFWSEALLNLQPMLEHMATKLSEEPIEMEDLIHPHPISGPINIIQRFEFLRFHLNRHQAQVERVKASPGFPAAE